MNYLKTLLQNEGLSITLDQLLSAIPWIPFPEARRAFRTYTGVWGDVISHLTASGGISPAPVIPFANQQAIVFHIDKPHEIRDTLSNTSTAKIACILCVYERNPGTTDDNVISVILAGLDSYNRPTMTDASEKWPVALTVSQTAATATSNYLTASVPPATSPSAAELTKATALLTNFEANWNNLLSDCSSPIGARPNFKKNDHPVAFIIPRDEFDILMSNPSLSNIVGFFGYTEAVNSGTPGYIAPFFMGLDSAGKPVTNIIFTDSVTRQYPYTDRSDVVNNLLTP